MKAKPSVNTVIHRLVRDLGRIPEEACEGQAYFYIEWEQVRHSLRERLRERLVEVWCSDSED
jgi:hypothetical protein